MPYLPANFPKSAASWLALYPKAPIKPTAHPQRDPAVLARIEALGDTLFEIKETLDARKHLLNLYAHGGLFCPSCTPCTPWRQHPGSCGAACPLLRPSDETPCIPFSRKWIEVAEATIEVYRGLVAAFNACGSCVRIAQLRQWEGVVELLRLECLSWWELEVEQNQGMGFEVQEGVFTEGWGFGGSWKVQAQQGDVKLLG